VKKNLKNKNQINLKDSSYLVLKAVQMKKIK